MIITTFWKVQKDNSKENIKEFTSLCYNEFYKQVFVAIYYKCNRKQLAQDIVQDTFEKFIKALQKGKKMNFKSAENIKAYLLTMAYNTLKNNGIKKANQELELKPIYDAPIPNQAEQIAFDIDWEQKWSKYFSPQEQKIYTLMTQGYPIKEIAEILNINYRTLQRKSAKIKMKIDNICNIK